MNIQAELRDAVPVLVNVCGSGGEAGRKVSAIIWSLLNSYHHVNLHDALYGLDRETAEAVLIAIRARALLGPDCDMQIKAILVDSGEFDRFDPED